MRRKTGSVSSTAAAQLGADAGEELGHAERLGEIVVGAFVEGEDLHLASVLRTLSTMIGVCATRRTALCEFEAVHLGHGEVGDDEVGPLSDSKRA